MPLRENKLKAKLKRGEVIIGTLTKSRGPYVAEALAKAGVDYLDMDAEHTNFDMKELVETVNYAHMAGVTPMVRLPALEQHFITRLLDNGCQSLVLPSIRTGAEAQRFIEFAKFYPEGKRALGMYGVTDLSAACAYANDNTLLGLIIETPEALENLDEILIPGIDVVWVGHTDLSHLLGIAGQFDHPKITEARDHVRAMCQGKGVAFCQWALPPTPGTVKSLLDSGIRWIAYGSDLSFLESEARKAVDEIAAWRG
jgi:2-dehydro-3-deoxyglucarate aldolase/4-hydroxy-2-oxoheptanedioate aldolase